MKWYFKVVRDYKNFQGRACRKEYWTYQLINFIILFFALLAFMIGDLFSSTSIFGGTYYPWGGINENSNWVRTVVIYISVFIAAGVIGRFYIIPNFAVMARRLHDIGRSSLYMLLVLIPLFSGMIFFYLQWKLQDSEFSLFLLIIMLIVKFLYFIGRMIILVLTLLDSKPTTNKWGPCPKPQMNYEATTNLRSQPTKKIINSMNDNQNKPSNHVQTKQCPYCGEQILIVAKKCKHCNEWLEKE